MARPVFAVTAVVTMFLVLNAEARDWETDFEKASAAARESSRYMLLDFTGSDWCGWCTRLQDEVFRKKEFRDYADRNLVCVELDFPRGKPQSRKLRNQNAELQRKYEVRGFPTIVILCPEGGLVAKTGYRPGGAGNYVKHLREIIDPHRRKNQVPEPGDPGKSASAGGNESTVRRRFLPPLAGKDDRELRTWTTRSGASVTAAVVQENAPYFIFRKEDGGKLRILARNLSDADRKYLEELKRAETGEAEAEAEK